MCLVAWRKGWKVEEEDACVRRLAWMPLTPDIAGVPGTGKTATVHAVVKELKRKAEDGVHLYWCMVVWFC